MHLNTRSKITSFALKTLSGAVASAVILSSSAHAAGLGKLTVMSGLGQPLNAEIELTSVSAEEAKGLVAKLAPVDAFRVANIEFSPALLSLRFVVEQRGSRQFIKITSSQPVNEPFVDMLLELSWSSGKLVREYTFLLDPAELRSAQAPQVAAPVDVLSQGSRTTPARQGASTTRATPATSSEPARPAAAPAPRRERERAAAPAEGASAASQYKVQKGDSLGKIAANLKPVDVSLDMMLVALYRANPDAFNGNNMNRLKSGQILNVPDSAAIKGTNAGEARGVVIAHAADFNAYRNKLAGQVATAAPEKAQEASQSTGGKITSKVEERPTAANASQDKLKLSKAAAPADAGKTAGAEERIAKEKALADATARVKELERNVSELEKLVVVKNRAAAEAQKAPVAVAPPVPAKVATVVPPAPVATVKAPVVAEPAPVVQAPAEVAVPAAPAVPPRASPVKPKPAAELKKNSDVAEAPGIVDWILNNILMIIGALAGLGLLVAVALGLKKRRGSDMKSSNEPSILGAPTDQAHSLFAETGGQSVDTSNSVFNSSFAPSASQLDTNEVDPVAEADVYIAYGRDAQAEEILKEALRTHPERYPVRLKLLEIYAARKDARSFETQATDLYSMSKGSGDEWAQAAALGLSIDPLNPLYASAANAGPSTIIPVAAAATVAAVSLNKQSDADLDLTAMPAPVVVAPGAAPEDNTLDFDLGGLSFEPVDMAKAAPTLGTTNDIADMDFAMPGSAPVAPVLAKEEAPMDMDFNMDFDTPAKVPASVSHARAMEEIDTDLASNDFTAEYAAKDDLSGMGDLANAFNISATPVATPAHADHALDLDAMNFELPLSTTKAAPQFDMSGIDLDLPNEESGNTLPDFGDTLVQSPADLSAMHMEMETKLDLAIAYQEIGDKEGARELLDEVIKGGSGEQISKANDMRAKLA
ncbi:FimV/HubP family polar landmark protein [Massilia sp. TSP1-1-2]|uniref:FimV/HubP family polar landmark protein n=1 Tax=Massilia sp. TSP1-1-2 TaxID=2804649 RepID=UPI003CF25F55